MKIKPINSQHQKGILVLIGIIIGVVIFLFISVGAFYLIKKGDITIFEKNKEISLKNKDLKEKNKEKIYKNKDFFISNNRRKYYFKDFDPNTATKEELMNFNLSEKQAMNIINYRKAGGKYCKKEDLKKLYCMNDYLYSQMSPYVIIQQKEKSILSTTRTINQHNITNYSNKNLIVFDINNADTIDLQMIRGVGVVFARRIYNYGKKLGGYVKIEQLKEVWGMTNDRYNEIKKQVIVKKINTKKININTMNIKELTSHPYIDYYLAKEIIKFHQINGNYKKVEDIKKVHLIDEDTFNKLCPYLEVK